MPSVCGFESHLRYKRSRSSVVEQVAVNHLVVGSNPSEIAKWPVRLSVRTPGFQPVKTSSTLVRATKSAIRGLID